MAKPVWILLPSAPDWRWLLGRDDSPWYPTARLFRQTKLGDWASVIARVRDALGRARRGLDLSASITRLTIIRHALAPPDCDMGFGE